MAKPVTAAGNPGTKRIVIDPIKIEGRIQKPAAFYILQRAPLSLDEGLTPPSFVPRIFQPVDKKPF